MRVLRCDSGVTHGTTRIGTTVAVYRLEELIGRGGMSVVYLAEHTHLGRHVALKLLAPALSEDASFRERFERESRRAAAIDHPNIIPVYDAGEADGQLFLAMRYVKGTDLKGLIARDGPLGIARVLFLLDQAAGALDAAHDHALVHRDVKPANILVEDPIDRIYVTDFGIVKHTMSRGLTKTGYFVGTLDYAAPEMIEGMPVDARTDVYALGCVLYECLAGRPPYDREAEIAVMHAHLHEEPPPLSAVRPGLPLALDRVIARAMAKNKDERYASCRELIQAARAAVLQQPAGAPPPSEPPTLAPGASDAAAASLAATAAAGAGGPPPAPPLAVGSSPAEGSSPSAATTLDTGDSGAPPPPAGPTVLQTDEPKQPPPAGNGDRGRRSWLLGGVAALLAAAVAGVLVWALTRPDDSNSPAAATEQAQTATAPTTAEQATTADATTADATTAEATNTNVDSTIAALVPNELEANCTEGSPPAGATDAATCAEPADSTARFYPDSWELLVYPDTPSLDAAFEQIREEQGLPADTGRCNGVTWGGEGAWNHGPDKPGGRRLCYFDGNDAVMVWTHDKFDQEDHLDVLGIAREGGRDHAALFDWWRFWHHRIGRLDN